MKKPKLRMSTVAPKLPGMKGFDRIPFMPIFTGTLHLEQCWHPTLPELSLGGHPVSPGWCPDMLPRKQKPRNRDNSQLCVEMISVSGSMCVR